MSEEKDRVDGTADETKAETKSSDHHTEDTYEKVCFMCRRPESKAGKMITLPGNINICPDCMQKSFDTMNQNPGQINEMMNNMNNMPNIGMLDLSGLSNQIPNRQRVKKKEEKKKPLIMARLLNVESLLSSMVCKEEMDQEFVLYDPIIRENNCLFMLKGNEEHLVVRTRTAHTGKDDAVQKISIDALTSIVFGYKELEKIEEEEKEIFSAEFKEEISKLMPFSPVFINEIV